MSRSDDENVQLAVRLPQVRFFLWGIVVPLIVAVCFQSNFADPWATIWDLALLVGAARIICLGVVSARWPAISPQVDRMVKDTQT